MLLKEAQLIYQQSTGTQNRCKSLICADDLDSGIDHVRTRQQREEGGPPAHINLDILKGELNMVQKA